MTAISVSYSSIANSAIDPDSPITQSLMTALRNNTTFVYEWLGAGFAAGAVQDHNHDGVNSSLIEVGPNRARNGSFEDGLAGWAEAEYTGGTVTTSNSTQHHGEHSLSITSTVLANGGGYVTQNEFMPVAGGESLQIDVTLSASVANISARVEVLWYDKDQASVSTSTVLDLTNSPTSGTNYYRPARAPSSARFAKVRLTGGVPATGSATGTIFFDGVSVSVGANLVLLDMQEASTSASLDFTDQITDRFVAYELHFQLVPDTAPYALQLRFSQDGGSTWRATTYYNYVYKGHTSAPGSIDSGAEAIAAISVTNSAIRTLAGTGAKGKITILNPAAGNRVQCLFQTVIENSAVDRVQCYYGSGFLRDSGAVDGFQLRMSSGNLASGFVRLYGVRQ